MPFLKKHYQLIVLGILAVVFFFIYSYLSLATPLVFNSPDENANYFFSKLFAEEGRLWEFEPLEFATENSIFPRSIKALDGRLAPVGFLGLPLIYGLIAKGIGSWSIIFLTPLFAVLAVLAFYGLCRKIFNDNIAFLSSILMFALPPFWYYATRGMFHNLLFISFLIISFYFIQKAYADTDVYRKVLNLNAPSSIIGILGSFAYLYKFIFYALGGLFLGLALMTRLSEFWWIFLICLLMLFIGYSDPTLRRYESRRYGILIILAFFVLTFTPFLFQNQILYGSPFATGYQAQVQDGNSLTMADGAEIAENATASLILPFGLHPRTIAWSVENYYLRFFPWLIIPAFLGILIFLFKKNKTRGESFYFFIFLFITAWLFVYYGSWKFNDNIDPNKITIGTSYLRYWLPGFIMLLPFLSKFILFVAGFLKFKAWKLGIPILASAAFFYLSFFSVFHGEDEGILRVKQTLAGYNVRAEEVFELTEENSIIITDRSDKLFFPERRIIYPLRSNHTYNLLPDIINLVPIYYYGITLPEKDIVYLNEERLEGVRIEELKRWGNESLYKFN